MNIKPSNDFRAGFEGTAFRDVLNHLMVTGRDVVIDLSEVIYMDTFAYRLIFDNLPLFKKVIPPKDKHIIELYNEWLDSKKGLSK